MTENEKLYLMHWALIPVYAKYVEYKKAYEDSKAYALKNCYNCHGWRERESITRLAWKEYLATLKLFKEEVDEKPD